MAQITLCVSLKDYWPLFQRMVASVADLNSIDQIEMAIADFGSTDVDLNDALASVAYPRMIGKSVGNPFLQPAGHNALAFNATAPILCFLDADIVVPPNFCELIQEHVAVGTAWYPLAYGLYADKPMAVYDDEPPLDAPGWLPRRANGWWRRGSRRLLAITKQDFKTLGGFSESPQVEPSWDWEFFTRVEQQMQAKAECVRGLFHLWHE